jgi:DNA-binding CsgD family transcriptional regulator
MAQSRRPRLRDLRRIYLLVSECCELGADPVAWRQHFVEGTSRMLGGQVAILTEAKFVAPFGEPGWLQPRSVVDAGWPAASDRQKSLERFSREGFPEHGLFSAEMFDPPVMLRVIHARSRLGAAGWRESVLYAEYIRNGYLDDWLHAHAMNSSGEVFWLDLNRATGDQPYSERNRRMLWLLHREVVQLLGVRLAKLGAPSVCDLAPRLKDVLVCLLQGDGEKQIALRLGISRHTVHHYVKQLHHRFAASSRGELLARCHAYLPVLSDNEIGPKPGDETVEP